MTRLAFLLLFLTVTLLTQAKSRSERTFFFTTSDSARLFVRVVGQGQPCVFVHGGPGTTSYYFEPTGGRQIEDFLTMIYFDQRGSGRSGAAPNGDYSISRMEKDLEEIRQHLGYKTWSVMGHSFAGIIVTNYAAHYPGSLNRLILVDCTLNLNAALDSYLSFGIQELNLTDPKYTDASVPKMQRMGQVSQVLHDKKVWYKLMFATPEAKVWSDSVTNSIQPFTYEFGQKAFGMPEYLQDYTPLTVKIAVPTLVMTGKRDFAIGPMHYRSFRFPNQQLAIHDGGHVPFQENPDWFVTEIRQFVSQKL